MTGTEQIQKDLEEVLRLAAIDNSKHLAAEIVAIVHEALNGNLTPPVAIWPWSKAPPQLMKMFDYPEGVGKPVGDWVILFTKSNSDLYALLPIDTSQFDIMKKDLWDGATILFLF